MFSEYNFKNFNFRLLFYALALNAIGLLVINSAVNGDRSYINRQLIGLFGGLVIMLFLALTDYHKLMRCTGVRSFSRSSLRDSSEDPEPVRDAGSRFLLSDVSSRRNLLRSV